MTIAATNNRNDYVGDGTLATYAFTFPVDENHEEYLLVKTVSVLGVESTLVITTDYTVNMTAKTITLVAGNLGVGIGLTIQRILPLTQPTDIRNQGYYFPETHENVFDRLTEIIQQQQDQIDRSIKAASTDADALDMTLPPTAVRASQYLGFTPTGAPTALGAPASTTAVSVFGASFILAASASAGMDLLGFSAYFKTLIASATAAAMRTLLGFDSSGLVNKALMDSTSTLLDDELGNLGISCAVAANALTVTLTDAAGAVPSAASPVSLVFRNATSATGTVSQVRLATGKSVVVSSGSTLGHTSAVSRDIYVYAMLFSGAVELAVSSKLFDEGTIQSSTAEGGAGAADSASVLYSTTARANVPIRLIGRLKSTQATAGTWATAISEVTLVPFARPSVGVTDGSNASTGIVGETISGSLARSAAAALAANTPVNVTSIALTAGDWVISGGVNWRTANTTADFYAAINTVSATLPGGDSYMGGDGSGVITMATEGVSIATGKDYAQPIPSQRVSLTATTTFYLIAQSNAANNKPNGFISATRIR